jgi:hypothetical protein
MNWDAIGAVGEIVGAIAVVATLIYLASQVRYAKAAASDANRLERASGVREMIMEYIRNPDLRTPLVKSLGVDSWFEQFANEFDLSIDEAMRIDYHNLYWFWLHWGQYASTKDAKDVKELKNLIGQFYVMPVMKYSWDHGPFISQMEPEFREFVNQIIEDTKIGADGT